MCSFYMQGKFKKISYADSFFLSDSLSLPFSWNNPCSCTFTQLHLCHISISTVARTIMVLVLFHPSSATASRIEEKHILNSSME